MKKLLVFVLAVLLFLGCFGCAREGEDEIRLIGVLQPNLTAAWQLELKADIDSAVAKHENIKCIYADAGNSVEKQISDIEDMIKRQVDVIIVFACDEHQISDTLKKAVQEGIRVIILGYAPYDSDAYTVQLFINNYKVGYVAGLYACEVLQGEGVILEVQDDPAKREAQEKKRGFLAAIADYPDIVKEYVIVGYGTKDNASYALTTSEILKEDTKIDFVFSHNNEMAAGIYTALKVNEIEPIIVGTGCDENGAPITLGRELNATVVYETLGEEAIECAVRLMNG